MATNQSMLDSLRAQAGLGTGNFTRPNYRRSADQNQTISGNPGYASNQPQAPQSWQQQMFQNQNTQRSLAQSPDNFRMLQMAPPQQMPADTGYGGNDPSQQMDPRTLMAQNQGGGQMGSFGGMFGGSMPMGFQGGAMGQPQQMQTAMPALRRLQDQSGRTNMGPSLGRFTMPALR